MKQTSSTKIPLFEEFQVAGFGPANQTVSYSTGGSTPTTGYSMQPIVGQVNEVCESATNEACSYEDNENPEHNGDSYIVEAKKYVCDKIDESYKKKKTW